MKLNASDVISGEKQYIKLHIWHVCNCIKQKPNPINGEKKIDRKCIRMIELWVTFSFLFLFSKVLSVVA